MTTAHVHAAHLRTLLRELDTLPDDTAVQVTISAGQLTIKTPAGESSQPIGSPTHPSGPTPRTYLDLSTRHLPTHELDSIESAPPTVIPHPYGAWIHVPPAEANDDPLDINDELTALGWEDFPHLRQILLTARDYDAGWVNLDSDGHDTIESLPTFDS